MVDEKTVNDLHEAMVALCAKFAYTGKDNLNTALAQFQDTCDGDGCHQTAIAMKSLAALVRLETLE